jgi:hypothetical protein
MRSEAKTVEDYIDGLSPERRKAIAKVRSVIRKNLPKGFVETMNWGMISYEVPLKRYPDTYNKQPLMLAAVASQKNHMAVYLSSIYADSKERNMRRAQDIVRGSVCPGEMLQNQQSPERERRGPFCLFASVLFDSN